MSPRAQPQTQADIKARLTQVRDTIDQLTEEEDELCEVLRTLTGCDCAAENITCHGHGKGRQP